MDPRTTVIQQFRSISLEEMDRVALLNRTDTKFVFSFDQLIDLLRACEPAYRILEINGIRLGNYQTLYFDTGDFSLYQDHHRGREKRFKVRMREYVDSNLSFLEVKFKNKGRTDKKRTRITGIHDCFTADDMNYLQKVSGKRIELNAVLWNRFQRITLVSDKYPERVTIDLNLGFKLPGQRDYVSFPNLVIAEVKQDNRSRNTLFMQTVRTLGIRECGMSKYCVGLAMNNDMVKYNNFKDRILKIHKLNNAA